MGSPDAPRRVQRRPERGTAVPGRWRSSKRGMREMDELRLLRFLHDLDGGVGPAPRCREGLEGGTPPHGHVLCGVLGVCGRRNSGIARTARVLFAKPQAGPPWAGAPGPWDARGFHEGGRSIRHPLG